MRRLAAALLLSLWGSAASAAELIMVEDRGCVWCARFDAEIAPGYPKTPEGRRAPLRRVNLREPWPEGVAVRTGARYTPTFILVDDQGREVARLVGYPGADFFYPALAGLLAKLPVGE